MNLPAWLVMADYYDDWKDITTEWRIRNNVLYTKTVAYNTY